MAEKDKKTDEILKEVLAELKTINERNKKIDLVINELKKKDSDSEKREELKVSLQFFMSSLLGAFSAVLLYIYIIYPSFWFISVIFAILFGLSLLFGYSINNIIDLINILKRLLRKNSKVKHSH